MCGRYAITLPPEAVRAWFGYPEQPNFPPRYNIAPTQPIPIVARDPDRPADGGRHFRLVRWGFVPGFVKDFNGFPLIINARSEEIGVKASFRAALLRRRCLVIADGWYEWRHQDGRRPGTPFLFRRADAAPIAFAGLWERWAGANGSEVDTGCIVTTAAAGSARAIHPRMPVMLERADEAVWLDLEGVRPAEAVALLRPAADGLLTIAQVGPAVNKVANDDPSLQEPVEGGRPLEDRQPRLL